MKLINTDKYFPKTFSYLKKQFGDQQISSNLPKFIKEYSLSGLSIIDPRKAKSVKVMTNDVDDADDKAIASVKQFNGNLDLMPSDYCLFICPLHQDTNAVLLDDNIYDALNEFVTSHYHISDFLRKYVNVDKLLLNDIKSGKLQIVVQRSKNYIVYDIYEPIYKFDYSVNQLSNFILIALHHDEKAINSIPSDMGAKVQHDTKLYNSKIKPILPLLMTENVRYYNQAVKHGRLLHLTCIRYDI